MSDCRGFPHERLHQEETVESGFGPFAQRGLKAKEIAPGYSKFPSIFPTPGHPVTLDPV
ncbi:MAG: hypothetical protein F6K49_12615 [Moorea sp. SIO3I6]|nr:hypothetical protein [Moorena sp. SIO3I6]